MDSNHRRYKPADLQSAPFGHSGILPFFRFFFAMTSSFFVSSVIYGSKLPSSSLDFLVLTKKINFKTFRFFL